MTPPRYYLDTSVILVAAGPPEHPEHDTCTALMNAIADAQVLAQISSETLVECLHAATWHQARSQGLALIPLLQTLFPHPIPLTGAMVDESVLLLRKYPRLGVRAALHASAAQAAGSHDIISYTSDFGLIAGMRRWEPGQVVDGQRSKAR